MLENRKSGILLHISSLPSKHGIGDLGEQAYNFIDKLEQMGQVYWQILPTNEPNDSNSPYDTSSAFAQNPMFISLDLLLVDGLLDNSDIDHTIDPNSPKIDFNRLKKWKLPLLTKAAIAFQKKFKHKQNDDFKNWTNEWEKRLKQNNSSDKYLELMKKTNPIVIPRNQKVEDALADADKGNLETMNKLLKVLSNPYSDQENIIEFQKPTPIGNEKYQTFCGT